MNWRTGGHHPGLLVQLQEEDLSRVGNCWMSGRLKVGDLLLCLSHRGDCFWDYIVIEHGFMVHNGEIWVPGFRGVRESKLGAYVLGTPYATQPTEKEHHLLAAGETTPLSQQAK